MNNSKRTAIEYGLLLTLCGVFLAGQYRGSFSNDEHFLFAVIMLTYIWTAFLLFAAQLWFGLRLFEPLSIIAVIYMGIFIIKPMVDLRGGKMVEHGINVLPGGAKATALFALGFTVFYVAYYCYHPRTRRDKRIPAADNGDLHGPAAQSDQLRLYLMWAIVYVLCIVGMMSQGLSLRYIFSFGAEGVRSVDSANTILLFLSNFGVTLAALWVMIMDRGTNKAAKILVTVLSVVYVLMRNARWLALVFLAAPITLYYLKRRKQPRLLWVAVIAFAGLLVFAWMQSNRYSLAMGRTMTFWGLQDFTASNFLAPLESDLSTYRSFYSMVMRYPSQHPYLLGQTFLYTFVLFVPRVLWPGKPDNPIHTMIEYSLNARARSSGTAVANIGELYANFGVLGIIIGMLLLGIALSALKRRMEAASRNGDTDFLRCYAVIFPLLFQWIARGNFCGNFYLTVFAVLPYLIGRLRAPRRRGV